MPRLTAEQLRALEQEDAAYNRMMGRVSSRLMSGLALAPAALNINRVARSKRTSKADVANETAADAGRWATTGLGAEAGAALGALGGPFAPATVPLGGMIGGVAGYLGGDKLIRAGRRLLGAEEEDPIDRIKRAADSGRRKLNMRDYGTEQSHAVSPMYRGNLVESWHNKNPNWRNLPLPNEEEQDALGYAKGGHVKFKPKKVKPTKMVKMASGGSVSSRADGIAKKGKTNCKYR